MICELTKEECPDVKASRVPMNDSADKMIVCVHGFNGTNWRSICEDIGCPKEPGLKLKSQLEYMIKECENGKY